jgi:hypothetical protein
MLAPAAPAVTGVASSAVAALLRGPRRPLRTLGAFRAAVYLDHDDGVLTLVTSDGVAHPNAVVVGAPAADAPFAGLRPHVRGTVGEGRIDLPGLEVRVARWRDPRPRLGPVDHRRLTDAVAAARRQLAAATHADPGADDELATLAAAVADAIAAGDEHAAVAAATRLLGRGPGLTPAGDDVLAGLLAATVTLAPAVRDGHRDGLVATAHAVGERIAVTARDATTAVSAALLHHAARGEVAVPAAQVLHALTGRGDLPAALTDLLAVGSTSGRDLTLGILAGADLVLSSAPVTHPVLAPAPTYPVLAPAPTYPVLAPAPTNPVLAPAPTNPVLAPAPTNPETL